MEAHSQSPDDPERLFASVVAGVTLRVSDLDRQRDFYSRAIGLEPGGAGGDAVDLASPDRSAFVRLDTSAAHGSEPVGAPHTGLFHTAFRYPDRASLGAAVARTVREDVQYQGASDHGVSEAVYFADPEGNGIELYRDRPYEVWPAAEPGRVGMFTQPLDVRALLEEADEAAAADKGCDIGHIHLMTADAEGALAFWRDLVELDERQRFGDQAIFLADGLYHHHLGANAWHSAGAPPGPRDRPGLASFELRLAGAGRVEAIAARLGDRGYDAELRDGALVTRDPDENEVSVRERP